MERLSQAFSVTFLGGVLCSLMMFVPLWGPQLVFMRLAARRSAQARTYSTIDAMVLTFYLALANALVALTRNEMETGWLLALAMAANVFVVLMWIKCQRFMRERSIERQLSRLLVEAILYPVSVIAVGILSFNTLALLSLLEVFEDGIISGGDTLFSSSLSRRRRSNATCCDHSSFRTSVVVSPTCYTRLCRYRHRTTHRSCGRTNGWTQSGIGRLARCARQRQLPAALSETFCLPRTGVEAVRAVL